MKKDADHFPEIYSTQAAAYHQMIAVEDVDQNLLKAIQAVTSLEGKRALDLGTGTGRIPILLHDHSVEVVAMDLHRDMLRENAVQRQTQGGKWGMFQGDMRFLPLAKTQFDIVFAGWAIGHFGSWYPDAWKEEINRVVQEMHRQCKVGGTVMIMETLSTGATSPAPPTPRLAEYYAMLENEWGFERQAIQTDYLFESVEQAVAYTEFFFGEAMSALIHENQWARLPEWTGVWSKKVN